MKLNSCTWKKEKPINALYKVYLQTAQDWGKTWYPIEKSVNESQNKELECKYKEMDDRFKKLNNCIITIKHCIFVLDGVHIQFFFYNMV